MSDERKDQNLPARPASSLMGQLVRQRQGADVVPTQQQTGLAGQQAATGVGGKTSAPPTGQSGMARPSGPATAVGAGRTAGAAVEAAGPSRAEIERIDAKDDGSFGHGSTGENTAVGGDLGAKFSANQQLIREREKFIIDQLRRELDTSRLTNISEDTQAQVRARIREIVNSDPAPLTMMEKGILLQNI